MYNGSVRPHAQLITNPFPRLVGHGRVVHIPGVTLAIVMNAEEINPGLYMHSFNGSVVWVDGRPKFEFNFEIRGHLDDLKKMAHLIRLRQLLTHEDQTILGVVGSSMRVARMAPRDQWSIFAEIRTEDEPGIVRQFCSEVLAEQGTLTVIHCDTASDGIHPGVADFYLRSDAAFATRAAAEAAIARIEALPFRHVFACPLFGSGSRPLRPEHGGVPELPARLARRVEMP